MESSKKKGSSTLVIILVVVGIVLGVLVLGGGVLAAMAVYGVRKYVSEAKTNEGRSGVGQMVRAVMACAEAGTVDAANATTSELPPSTRPVPSSIGFVSGKKYQSTPQEWEAAGFECIQFKMMDPQYFQYQWERTSPTSGVARAQADLDGDGNVDHVLELPVQCEASETGLTCTVSPTIVEK